MATEGSDFGSEVNNGYGCLNGERYEGIERRKWKAILRGEDYFMCREIGGAKGLRSDE